MSMSQHQPAHGPAVADPPQGSSENPLKEANANGKTGPDIVPKPDLASEEWESGLKRRIEMNKQLTEIVTAVERVLESSSHQFVT